MTTYNTRNSAVKRIMVEASDLQKNPGHRYNAAPTEDNIFEWHFTISGPPDTEFEGGRYHGRIILPAEYPYKPPSILFLTPNGRFELHKKICLSVTGYHPEFWMPAWGVRTVLLAIIGFMPQRGNGAIGAIDCEPEERMRLAKKSRQWFCEVCKKKNLELLSDEQVALDGTTDADQQEGELPDFKMASSPTPEEQKKDTSTSATASKSSGRDTSSARKVVKSKGKETIQPVPETAPSPETVESSTKSSKNTTSTTTQNSNSSQTRLNVTSETNRKQLDYVIAIFVFLLSYLVYNKLSR